MNTERRSAGQRGSADRRNAHEFRLVIPHELQEGWLALQAPSEKLRLSPIPDGWMHLSDEELGILVARAGTRPNQQS